MELTTRGRYAVMAMADLASQPDDAPAPLSQIAERQGLPLSYLEQIFGPLRRAGLVESARGRTGGYRLARPAAEISVDDVMAAVDEETRFTRCTDDDARCSRDKPCLTHDLWTALGQATSEFFSRVSLADVANGKVIAGDAAQRAETSKAHKGGKRIYLDYNATAPLRDCARDAMIAALDVAGNPSSVHAEGRAARGVIETAREHVARLVGSRPSEVVFTSGATEANAWVMAQPWNTIFVSGVEHDSVLQPARASGASIITVPAGRDGLVRIEEIAARVVCGAPTGRTLVSLQAANNETGVVQPLAEMAHFAREHGLFMHSDAVQAAGRLPIDFAVLGLDLMSVSAHKLGGPKGVGVLVIRDRLDLAPLIRGGGQERRRRAGTENLAAIAGFGAAAEAALADRTSATRIAALRDRLESAVREFAPQATIICKESPRLANTSSIALPGRSAETLVIKLDLAGVAVSAGAACSSGKVGVSPALEAMGFGPEIAKSAVRVSLGPATTEQDIAAFIAAFKTIVSQPALAA
ncbi:MAG: aminotransferase class V-fold PLP-dependent enzyme [Hyphomicrobium sp.]